jgi:DoxX-like family
MTTFAPHRDTLESFVDCIHGGADKDTLTRLLAKNVRLYGPFGDEPVTGREAAVETIKTVNGLSSDDTSGIAPILTPAAAVGLALLQVGAAVFHGRRGEYERWPVNAVFLVLAVSIAVARTSEVVR